MRIAFGCDHRALDLKRDLIIYGVELGHTCDDLGTYDEAPVDYPDVACKVAQAVVAGKEDRGVLICGTGIGMSIAANKVNGARAALCHDVFTAGRARQHNDANVLCLGAEVVEKRAAEEILRVFMTTAFEGGRHARRVEKMTSIERG
ncbi:MAG: ribose 5-phosphate isomerase B [Chloroflexi bacterium]|nr:ribose 5-phosphate isomerase B [Chloroflexota bacterium]